jgi:hypothetical protein
MALTDRQAAVVADMTEAEADAWEKLSVAAGAIMKLEPDHPSQHVEYAQAIHVLQRALLARPTYRTIKRATGYNPLRMESPTDPLLEEGKQADDRCPRCGARITFERDSGWTCDNPECDWQGD